MNSSRQNRSLRIVAAVALAFGLATMASGGRTLFGGEAQRLAAGAYVPFVLWFNFVAGFAYVAAGAGLWMRQRWAVVLAWLIAITTLLVFAALGVHVSGGGAYEARTVAAMTLRSLVWLGIAWAASRALGRTA
jgi:hypothetical protein